MVGEGGRGWPQAPVPVPPVEQWVAGVTKVAGSVAGVTKKCMPVVSEEGAMAAKCARAGATIAESGGKGGKHAWRWLVRGGEGRPNAPVRTLPVQVLVEGVAKVDGSGG